MIDEFMSLGWEDLETLEFIDFNIFQMYLGENNPIYRASTEYQKYLCYEQLVAVSLPQLTDYCNTICSFSENHSDCSCVCHGLKRKKSRMKNLLNYL